MVPFERAGAGVQRQQAVGVQFGSRGAAVQVAHRREDDAVLLIDGDGGPDIGAAAVLPLVADIAFMVGLARLGHGVEGPDQFARPHVPGAHVATRTGRAHFAGTRAGDDQVVVEGDRVGNGEGVATAFAHHVRHHADIGVDLSALAEIRRQLARTHVQRRQITLVRREDDAWAVGRVARPPGDAATVDVALRLPLPQHLAGLWLQGGDGGLQLGNVRIGRRRDIHDPVDHQGRHLPAVIQTTIALVVGSAAVAEGPGSLKAADILRRDLRQGREVGRAGILAVAAPGRSVVGRLSSGLGPGLGQGRRCGHEDQRQAGADAFESALGHGAFLLLVHCAGSGVTSASVRPSAHLMPSSWKLLRTGSSQIASTWPRELTKTRPRP